jgi:outer membrane lipoprotein-sorting protein
VTLLALALTLVWAVPAWAGSKGDEIIKKMDESMTRAEDQFFHYDVVTQEPGKAKRTLSMDVTIKGDSWRRVDYTAPGDVKGMKVLIHSMDKMWVYMPQFRKVRRVASHVRDQGFMGTTYSHDDMSVVTYGKLLKGKLLEETKTHWKVEGRRRPGVKYGYAKVIFNIHKKYRQPTEIYYYNDKGQKVKTEIRREYQCKDNVCNAKIMKLTDHTRNGAWTKFVNTEWKVNTGVSDRYFSVRQLQRGR